MNYLKKKPSPYEIQADKFLKKHNTTFEAIHLYYGPYFPDEKVNRDVYECILRRDGKAETFRFGQSIQASAKSGHLSKRKPTAYDLLACLTKSNSGTLDEFCTEFGYDTDSRRAEETYLEVQREFKKVQNLFGDCLSELEEIA